MALFLTFGESGASPHNQVKLVAPEGGRFDRFGQAVAITSDYLIVGAPREDTGASNAGSVSVYSRTSSEFIRTLQASQPGEDHLFGWSLAAEGNRVLIGAPGDDSGAAYLFDLDSGEELQKLLPIDPSSGDQFGHSVALSARHALVGAWLEDADDLNPSENSGAAYLFDAVSFLPLRRLRPNDSEEADQFGGSVALTNTTACVGALFDNHSGASDAGSVTVFDLASGQQLRALISESPAEGDVFGVAIAAKDDLLVIGASEADAQGDTSGAAYLYQISNGELLSDLLPEGGGALDRIGISVAISDRIIVGAFRAPVRNLADAGVAHLFSLTGNYEETLQASDADTADFFGNAVAGFGTQVIVGSVQDDDAGPSAGSAYVFSEASEARLENLTIRVTGGQLELRWLATPGRTYRIYTTQDLQAWPTEPSFVHTPSSMNASFTDVSALSLPKKFYRIVAE